MGQPNAERWKNAPAPTGRTYVDLKNRAGMDLAINGLVYPPGHDHEGHIIYAPEITQIIAAHLPLSNTTEIEITLQWTDYTTDHVAWTWSVSPEGEPPPEFTYRYVEETCPDRAPTGDKFFWTWPDNLLPAAPTYGPAPKTVHLTVDGDCTGSAILCRPNNAKINQTPFAPPWLISDFAP